MILIDEEDYLEIFYLALQAEELQFQNDLLRGVVDALSFHVRMQNFEQTWGMRFHASDPLDISPDDYFDRS